MRGVDTVAFVEIDELAQVGDLLVLRPDVRPVDRRPVDVLPEPGGRGDTSREAVAARSAASARNAFNRATSTGCSANSSGLGAVEVARPSGRVGSGQEAGNEHPRLAAEHHHHVTRGPAAQAFGAVRAPSARTLLTVYSNSDILFSVVRPKRTNPLALAVLASLSERPMHPYEVAHTLRTRAKHESIRLNYGSLYSVVEGLEKRGLIRARETTQEGRRPPRTVYEITAAGKQELAEWLSELLSTPVKEYLQFEAGISLMPALPPEEIARLLRQRCEALEARLAQLRGTQSGARGAGLPRLFTLEDEYLERLCEAELDWVRVLVGEIESGSLEGIEQWRSFAPPDRADPEEPS